MSVWGPTAATEDAHERQDSGVYAADNNPVYCAANLLITQRYAALFRFVNVTIPAGSTINSATWYFSPNNTTNDDANIDVYCEDVDDCPDLASLADVMDTRCARKTTASYALVQDSLTEAEQQLVITDAVAEVIARPGWASGQAIGVLVVGRSDADKILRVENIGTGPAPARLAIDYTEPAAGVMAPYYFQSLMGG